ncbi:dihydroxyacetone kinase subunit DhaK [Cellulosilyticum sp. I15G10I2]|uniref:dihydroxyacetone kinase subunit DhaK n=1 Tax=Cellulosilyticum sp. I15G10I2 TaxID=1892843 RepID=UPI00085BE4D5|nr:dihydroxyacetone kinase subunit DhaK [Cellulosilyticum sp. I15G10I2]
MKKIINKPESVVMEMCSGIALAHPELEFLSKYKIIKKVDINPDKVTLISGGGSGHEPAHAGFVGRGMLDAAVCGDVFASPSQIQVYQAIKETKSNKGTLLIIKNYSGDVMNFKNAAYLAQEDMMQVDYIKVEDDIAVQDSLYTVGRRGVAGTVFVHKVAGAAAERGYSLNEVKRLAQKAADHVRSIGFALTSCTVPAKGSPTFTIEEGEMEYGVGIHGEPGIQREDVSTADVLADRMVKAILKDLKIESSQEERIALLINGFGGTPLQELYLLNHAVMKVLANLKMKVGKVMVGNYMTSIDMAGASVSIMKLDEELEQLLADEVETPALKMSGNQEVDFSIIAKESEQNKAIFHVSKDTLSNQFSQDVITLENMMFLVKKMGEIIIENEIPFCELDSHAGDGDFGMSVAKGFKRLEAEWNEIQSEKAQDIGSFLEACSMVIMEHCGGASGPIWGSAFRAAGKYAADKKSLSLTEMAGMLEAVVKGIQVTGERSFGRGADIGDKTLMDALIPCSASWKKCAQSGDTLQSAFRLGAEEAVEGAKRTEQIVARMGRAGTVGERSLGYPDAGAHALGVIFTRINEAIIWRR